MSGHDLRHRRLALARRACDANSVSNRRVDLITFFENNQWRVKARGSQWTWRASSAKTDPPGRTTRGAFPGSTYLRYSPWSFDAAHGRDPSYSIGMIVAAVAKNRRERKIWSNYLTGRRKTPPPGWFILPAHIDQRHLQKHANPLSSRDRIWRARQIPLKDGRALVRVLANDPTGEAELYRGETVTFQDMAGFTVRVCYRSGRKSIVRSNENRAPTLARFFGRPPMWLVDDDEVDALPASVLERLMGGIGELEHGSKMAVLSTPVHEGDLGDVLKSDEPAEEVRPGEPVRRPFGTGPFRWAPTTTKATRIYLHSADGITMDLSGPGYIPVEIHWQPMPRRIHLKDRARLDRLAAWRSEERAAESELLDIFEWFSPGDITWTGLDSITSAGLDKMTLIVCDARTYKDRLLKALQESIGGTATVVAWPRAATSDDGPAPTFSFSVPLSQEMGRAIRG
jgi:hypothetical protein